jgi:hypothetical protein
MLLLLGGGALPPLLTLWATSPTLLAAVADLSLLEMAGHLAQLRAEAAAPLAAAPTLAAQLQQQLLALELAGELTPEWWARFRLGALSAPVADFHSFDSPELDRTICVALHIAEGQLAGLQPVLDLEQHAAHLNVGPLLGLQPGQLVEQLGFRLVQEFVVNLGVQNALLGLDPLEPQALENYMRRVGTHEQWLRAHRQWFTQGLSPSLQRLLLRCAAPDLQEIWGLRAQLLLRERGLNWLEGFGNRLMELHGPNANEHLANETVYWAGSRIGQQQHLALLESGEPTPVDCFPSDDFATDEALHALGVQLWDTGQGTATIQRWWLLDQTLRCRGEVTMEVHGALENEREDLLSSAAMWL